MEEAKKSLVYTVETLKYNIKEQINVHFTSYTVTYSLIWSLTQFATVQLYTVCANDTEDKYSHCTGIVQGNGALHVHSPYLSNSPANTYPLLTQLLEMPTVHRHQTEYLAIYQSTINIICLLVKVMTNQQFPGIKVHRVTHKFACQADARRGYLLINYCNVLLCDY